MTDHTLARLARTVPSEGGWVCRTRVEHLDWRPLVAAGLVEQAPALGHVRLTPAGRERLTAEPGTPPPEDPGGRPAS